MAADPRHFPGHLRLHAALIALCLVLGCASVAFRSVSEARPAVAGVGAPVGAGAAPSAGAQKAGPLSAPATIPAPLDIALAARGFEMPEGSDLYAVRVLDGPEGRVYQQYQAGGGALDQSFWPASSIKVLAALGALDFAHSLGYTGAATVTFDDDDSESRTIRSIYEPAIRDSSNYDYDTLVRIAGVDRLNSVFLTAAHGFPVTSITRSYAGGELNDSPAMIIEEGGRRTYVPARTAKLEPECAAGNCSNLFEMAESVRRIVLDDQLPAEQRFDLDPSDIKGLTKALLDAEGFFPPAVAATLGSGARIYSKPGDAADRDCLDVALIRSAAGKTYLLAAVVPHRSGGCDALVAMATEALKLLAVTGPTA